MVKKYVYADSENSDPELIEDWMEEHPTSSTQFRGKYKTYKGKPCKTKEEKKQSKAKAQKKWRLQKKTKAAKEFMALKYARGEKIRAIVNTKQDKREVK